MAYEWSASGPRACVNLADLEGQRTELQACIKSLQQAEAGGADGGGGAVQRQAEALAHPERGGDLPGSQGAGGVLVGYFNLPIGGAILKWRGLYPWGDPQAPGRWLWRPGEQGGVMIEFVFDVEPKGRGPAGYIEGKRRELSERNAAR